MLTAGPPQSVRAAAGLSIVQVQAHPWQLAYHQLKNRWPQATLHGTAVHVPIAAGEDVRDDIATDLRSLEVRSLATSPPTLDDAFVWLIDRRTDEP